jgi:hypothetical protein
VDKIFTLPEANQLIPFLEEHLTAIKRGKAVLVKTKPEIRRAAANAPRGGGSLAGPHYVRALEQISRALQEIHELGVHLKDLDLGLCDFPFMMEGRVVYLCWKLGEQEITWWHEISSGYNNRQPLEEKYL